MPALTRGIVGGGVHVGSRANVRALAIHVAAMVLLAALWIRWWAVPWIGIDLQVYVAGARAVLHDQDLYSVGVPNDQGGTLFFSYPPFAALVFVPLGVLGSYAAPLLACLSLLGLGVTAFVAVREAGWTRGYAVVLAIVGMTMEPVQRTLLYGQVNLVLIALVLLDACVVPRSRRGWLVGLAVGVKLTPGVFLLYLLLKRDWSACWRVVAGATVTAMVGWLVLPGESTQFWLHGLGSMSQFGGEIVLWGNQSLPAVVGRALQLRGAPALLDTLLTLGLIGLVSLLAIAAVQVQLAHSDRLAALTATGLLGLLVSPVSWTHHWVWILPALVVMVRRRWWAWAALTELFSFLPPMWLLWQRPEAELGYTPSQLLVSSAFVLWAVAFLGALAWEGRRERRRAGLPMPAATLADSHV